MRVAIDRDTAARLGVSANAIDQALYDAFGQREVSTIYAGLNQYRVVMEVAPEYWQEPDTLNAIYVASDSGALVPLSAIATFGRSTTPVAVSHQSQFPAVTLSFNLRPRASLGDAVVAVDRAARDIGMPASVHGGFQGTARVFQQSLASEPWLIAAALAAVYIVLGILYESLVHPADHPVDAAIGGRRRDAGTDGDEGRVLGHCAHRPHPADRHRQEERDHDDRRRDRRRAARGSFSRGGDPTRLRCCASGRF